MAVKDVEGAIKHRIFNRGIAADGTQIGQYDDTKKQTFLTDKAKPGLTKKATKDLAKKEAAGEMLTYKELRKLKGLQTDYVDLQFTGDLNKSIESGKENDKAVVQINNTEEQKIAGYLTEKYKKPIFQPSEKEVTEARELMVDFAKDEIRKIIATWR